MKKGILFITLFTISVLSVSAHVQVRLGMSTDTFLPTENPTIPTIASSFTDSESLMFGTDIEVIINHLGLGFTGGFNFPPPALSEDSGAVAWSGSLYAKHHFFHTGSFLDPFFGFGFGSAGRVDWQEETLYGKDNWGDYTYPYQYSETVSLALYPYASAGLGIDLGSLVLTGALQYHPVSIPVPELEPYNLTTFSASLAVSVGFGGRR